MSSLSCGIVGLPNVGKSTIFCALTNAAVESANYPFTTIEPNIAVVEVPDLRLNKLAKLLSSKKRISTTLKFVDIAGLVKGASKGEGLGNKFLGNIREVDSIIHVLRCFKGDTTHIMETINPLRDLEIINLELAISDLQILEKKILKLEKNKRSGDKKAIKEYEITLLVSVVAAIETEVIILSSSVPRSPAGVVQVTAICGYLLQTATVKVNI